METDNNLHRLEEKMTGLIKKMEAVLKAHNILISKYKESKRTIDEQEKLILEKNRLIKDFQKQDKKIKIVGLDEGSESNKQHVEDVLGHCLSELDEIIQDLESERK